MSDNATVRELPLLVQAEARLRAAREAENAARRAWAADASNEVLRTAYVAAQGAHRQAQAQLDRVRHGLTQVQHALPDARRDLVRAESELEQAHQTARQTIARAEREVGRALEAVLKLQADWLTIAGTEAGPPT
jgi:hypothetical protein